ncbi:MAG TPA: hypothetical protein VMF69_10570 [Gemmataceae bacterium]|nr:hypothetical protein [Gemmataceae bacterium]
MNRTPTLASTNVNLDPAIANLETVAELLERLGGIPASGRQRGA